MATFNSMLIPDFELTERVHTTPEGKHPLKYSIGIVRDQDDKVIWRSCIERMWATQAMEDAALAVDCICYARRHQLQLALGPTPLDDLERHPYLA